MKTYRIAVKGSISDAMAALDEHRVDAEHISTLNGDTYCKELEQ